MKYSFKIIDYTITKGFWENKKSEILFEQWKILKKIDDERFIVLKDKSVHFVDLKGNGIWKNSIKCSGIPNCAKISKDRLILTTNSENYHSWGHLEPVILIDLNNGTIIKELKGRKAETLNNGNFLLGLEGYDIFNTWLYDKNGRLLDEWRSYGNYLIIDQDVFVIEDDRNNPTRAYVSKLCPNGKIENGKKLKTSSSSNPLLLSDGNFIFENSGELNIISPDLREIENFKLLNYAERESWRFFSKISKEENILTVSILERSNEPPIDYKTHKWKITIE
ncbi:conserved protein of unknown function [Tenacibaculum sp. 190130A14a]|uniref:Uncharacterized protein n=1 Tax=Tenacibaculum polynesiense TaxID=3137857 RepID=A0ABM9PFN5_9FLAO